MAGVDQRGNLVAPIAAVAQATMQQDHGRTGPVSRVPDSRPVVLHVALIVCSRQGRGALLFENPEVVVVRFHIDPVAPKGSIYLTDDRRVRNPTSLQK
jgi:hypothetical protein